MPVLMLYIKSDFVFLPFTKDLRKLGKKGVVISFCSFIMYSAWSKKQRPVSTTCTITKYLKNRSIVLTVGVAAVSIALNQLRR